MPKNMEAEVWHEMRTLHKGEVPLTRFVDMEDAKKVTVLDYPGMGDAERELDAALSLARTCHNPEPVGLLPGDSWDALGDVAKGKTLWQTAEVLNFTLRLEGMSRILSHQMVRARVGWTYSETCTGDHDWRHGDFLVPRYWKSLPDLEERLTHMLGSKVLYAQAVDAGEAPNTARYLLHPNLKVFIHARTNLAALGVWYRKRCCTMTQAWEMVVLAEEVKKAVLKVCPWAAPAFVSPCSQGRCWYMGAKDTPLAMANYYRPDKIHDTFDWHPDSFLYDKTPYEMYSGPHPFDTRWYMGMTDRTTLRINEMAEELERLGKQDLNWVADPAVLPSRDIGLEIGAV